MAGHDNREFPRINASKFAKALALMISVLFMLCALLAAVLTLTGHEIPGVLLEAMGTLVKVLVDLLFLGA